MRLEEETIEATLDSNGQLQLRHLPHLPPGLVRVTIRASSVFPPRRGLSDVVREIAAGQRARGFAGRSADEIQEEESARQADDAARDEELESARRDTSMGNR
jgi:hypothetical protein